ncbi:MULTISPECIES: SAM-dependent methyltransferase [Kitasatospora]|uniref:S-adenosyl-L-methionine-dependent methyltransferase n=1 Tax=Kitasatospora setae (strain ATCC 33774 / DSM 43861 / JCM 3304 / KCC A-0304 / NBRC 14216 / KM-6054) TaxID=452652 RepID=E4N3C3_KITSK|nr:MULTISPECIES: SAM-dependent methyltransferase [Kitasatospora]BAJ32657.1 putative methyltransferase [Kitasatospora setae KM-6054]
MTTNEAADSAPATHPAAARLSPVSRTALSVARVRAYESAQSEPLFTDPYALAFIEAAGAPLPTAGPTEPFARVLVARGIMRTRFYDDRLLAAGVRQVVLLAAGLDTRAHRLEWPSGTRLFEIDLPVVLDFKQGVLDERAAGARCERIALAADLADPGWTERLLAAGFDPGEPTVWLAEGLLVYLDAEQAAGLLAAVGGLSAPGSRLLTEQGRDVSGVPVVAGLAEMTALWRGGLGTGTADWLDAHGWRTDFTAIDAFAASLGRGLPPVGDFTGAGFLEARRVA